MKAKTMTKDAESLIPKEELIKTLEKMSKNKKITSNPDWPLIKKGMESAIKGPRRVWKPPYK